MSDLYGGTSASSTCSSIDRRSRTTTATTNHHHNSRATPDSLSGHHLDDDGFVSLCSSSAYSQLSPGGGSVSVPASSILSRCPFSSAWQTSNVLEMDYGTNYYRTHFRDFDHQNWLQIHDKYGPIVVSLRKERIKNNGGGSLGSSAGSSSSSSSSSGNSGNGGGCGTSTRWRVIVRTNSLIPLRGTICALPSICSDELEQYNTSTTNRRRSSNSDSSSFNINTVKDVLSLVLPKKVPVAGFRLATTNATSLLLKLDEMSQNTEYKIGILYAHSAQQSEEEFYNNILDYNESTAHSPFYEFLSLISRRVRLKEFKGYKAGLDVANDTTGEYSWTAKWEHVDIMFHVCTELPFTETNRQQ